MRFAAPGFNPRRGETFTDDFRRLELQAGRDDPHHGKCEGPPRQVDREGLEPHPGQPVDDDSQRARRVLVIMAITTRGVSLII